MGHSIKDVGLGDIVTLFLDTKIAKKVTGRVKKINDEFIVIDRSSSHTIDVLGIPVSLITEVAGIIKAKRGEKYEQR